MIAHLKYYFENFISRKSNFIYFLVLMGAVFAVIILFIEMSFGLLEEGSLFNLWWNRLLQLLEIKNSEASNGKQIVNLLYWVFSVAFSGTIIAFLAAKISNFINDLKKGLSSVIDTNHYVIVGWNSSIFKVFQDQIHWPRSRQMIMNLSLTIAPKHGIARSTSESIMVRLCGWVRCN